MEDKRLRILSIGNSFSKDTMEHIGEIAKAVGFADFEFANLYIGGCSINRHYNNAVRNISDYVYYTNTGDGWSSAEHFAICDVVKEGAWDYISIQHGTGDKSRYTSPVSYDNLLPLIRYVKDLAGKNTKIAFNMAWVADPDSTHHEITSYGGDQLLMYEKLTQLTQQRIATLSEVDVVSPTGTAIQNARGYIPQRLTRDGFHLSRDLGRYIAGLTFLKALCDIDVDKVLWMPEGVTDREREIAQKAVNAAVKTPYGISPL